MRKKTIYADAKNVKFYHTRLVRYTDKQYIDKDTYKYVCEYRNSQDDYYNLLAVPLISSFLINLETLFSLNIKPTDIPLWMDTLPEHFKKQITYLRSINEVTFDYQYNEQVTVMINRVSKYIEDKYIGDSPSIFRPLEKPNENDFVPNPSDLGDEFISCRIRNIVHIPRKDRSRDWLDERIQGDIDQIKQFTDDNIEPEQIVDDNDVHLLFLEKFRADGTTSNDVKVIINAERPIYVTKSDDQIYRQKRIAEPLENLTEFRTTESDKWLTTHNALFPNADISNKTTYDLMKEVRLSPYSYGTEQTFTNLANYYYAKQFPHAHAQFSTYAYFDFEADVDSRIPSVASILMRDKHNRIKVNIFINAKSMPTSLGKPRKFLAKMIEEFDANPSDYPDLLSDELLDRHYKHPKIIKTEKLDINLVVCNNDMEVVDKIFKTAHDWKPHFVTAWNISYDLGVCIDTCSRYGIRFEDIVSTPGLPEAMRYFTINPGNTTFTSAKGDVTERDSHEVWSSYISASFFYLVDHMKLHYQIGKGEKVINTGYSLESIANHTFGNGIGKMKVPKEDEYRLERVTPKEKHAYLAKYRPEFYSAYNIGDNIVGLCILEKSQDLLVKFRALCEVTSFNDFGASAKSVIDPLSMHMLDIDDAVIGTNIIPDSETEKSILQGDVTRARVTIVLKSTYSDNNTGTHGALVSQDGANFKNIGTTISDNDVVSSYPSCGISLSVSKAACARELYIIHARNPQRVRKLMYSLTTGGGYELCVNGLNLPAPLEAIESAKKILTSRGIKTNSCDYLSDVKQAKPLGLLGGNNHNDKLNILNNRKGKSIGDREAMLQTAVRDSAVVLTELLPA